MRVALQIAIGDVYVYYDEHYDIGKFTIMRDGHQEYVSKDSKEYVQINQKIKELGGLKNIVESGNQK
jgi:hypothetical protein